MSIDRTALRRLLHSWLDADQAAVYKEVPDLLDELDAGDRRIAELEAAQGDISRDLFSMVCSERDDALLRLSIATELNVNDRKQIAALESQLAASRDIIRHFEQERDSWPAAYRERAKRTDARIGELEMALADAIYWIKPGLVEKRAEEADGERTRLSELLHSEET